jgi:hypothetical protein
VLQEEVERLTRAKQDAKDLARKEMDELQKRHEKAVSVVKEENRELE